MIEEVQAPPDSEKSKEEASFLCSEYSKLVSDRSLFESRWGEISKFIRPTTESFSLVHVRGEKKGHGVMESAAKLAASDLAGALHTFLTNPLERWFSLGSMELSLNKDKHFVQWMESVADTIFELYGFPDARLNTSLHEVYLDIVSFGNGILFQDFDTKRKQIVFRSFPLASCCFCEDHNETINTVYRKFTYTAEQSKSAFGGENLSEAVKKSLKARDGKVFEYLHVVKPRGQMPSMDSKGKAFVSVYLCLSGKKILTVSGYDTLPYHIGRWSKISGETCGRGPGEFVLDDVLRLERMSRATIKSAEKAVDPPLSVGENSYLKKLNLSPSAINYKQDGGEGVTPIRSEGRVDIGLEMMNQARAQIDKAFYSYLMRVPWKEERQSATEIMERREDQLRGMSPMLARVQSEIGGPMLRRTISLLRENGLIEDPPGGWDAFNFKIGYISPAAKAQYGSKALSLRRYFQEALPLQQAAPNILDALDFDEIIDLLGKAYSVPQSILKSKKEVMSIRENRAKQEQSQSMLAAGQGAASVARDVARAQKDMPSLAGGENAF